ncbi:MAG: ABC transporter permease [Desulfobacterota bacterium U4-17]
MFTKGATAREKLVRKEVKLFQIGQPTERSFGWGDVVVMLAVVLAAYVGIRLALGSPKAVEGPEISLSPWALPWYASLSIGRMAAAYALSMIFSLFYGYLAARRRGAERVMIPLLDILQSIPLLSFLPVVLLSFRAVFPAGVAAELASIVLIFTSQAWNLTFAWYQSLLTIPRELREASRVLRISPWMRFRKLELPFAAISLIWNSVMSWSGGWFFLMAAEIFSLGEMDFRLPGLGAYLQEAAQRGDVEAIFWGMGTLILVIVALDQVVWRPLLAWADKFKLEMVEAESPPGSWCYDALRNSALARWLVERIWQPWLVKTDEFLNGLFPFRDEQREDRHGAGRLRLLLWSLATGLMLLGVFKAGHMMAGLSIAQWTQIGISLAATLVRVMAALAIALSWTLPVGVAIGTNPRLAAFLQPLVQIAASVPATALFPIVVLILYRLPGGMDMAAVLLMLMGTQWYLLFNVIAGAMAIPQDLKYTATLLHLGVLARWRRLILPTLFPYIITGAMVASGGAWNASIVAEYAHFGGETRHTLGIGSLIAQATAEADYPLLLAGTLSMVCLVVLINRLVWRRLYQRAEELYRLE